MASLTIRNLDEATKQALRVLAARHGRSLGEEVRQILRRAVLEDKAASGLATRIVERFAAEGGIELPEIHRTPPRKPPAFAAVDEG